MDDSAQSGTLVRTTDQALRAYASDGVREIPAMFPGNFLGKVSMDIVGATTLTGPVVGTTHCGGLTEPFIKAQSGRGGVAYCVDSGRPLDWSCDVEHDGIDYRP